MECLSEPLVPVTVIVYVPVLAVEETVIFRADFAEPPDTKVAEDELRVAVRPEGAVAFSETVPPNPLREFNVIVEDPEDPRLIVMADGDAEIEKSGVATGMKLVVTGLPTPVARSYPALAEYPFDPIITSRK